MLEKEAGQALAFLCRSAVYPATDRNKTLSRHSEAPFKIWRALWRNPKRADRWSLSSTNWDRCRPSYAVELLEVAKHLFTVDHVVFALAVNRAELAQSVRALYGAGFDAEGYLRRFFDVDFRLPEADRRAFLEVTLDAIQIDDYFNRNTGRGRAARRRFRSGFIRRLLWYACSQPSAGCTSAPSPWRGVWRSLRDDRRSFAITAVVTLIVRTVDTALYHRFVRAEVSDKEVVDTVFSLPGTVSFRHTDHGIIFEAYIIASAYENTFADSASSESFSSPLLSHYQAMVEAEQPDNESRDPNREHAQEVLGQFQLSTFKDKTTAQRNWFSNIQLSDSNSFPQISLMKEPNKFQWSRLS